LINIALKYIDQNERIILNNSDGAVISYLGSTEDAMFIASDMRNEILKINTDFSTNLNVRIGIHLDHVKTVKNIDGQSNIIGIGLNAAKRIMSCAKPNEILVSRSYFENAPQSTQRIAKMYDDTIDKNVDYARNRQASLVSFGQNKTVTETESSISESNLSSLNDSAFLNRINWKYTVTTLLIFITIFSVIIFTTLPHQSTIPLKKRLKIDPEKVSINLPIDLKQSKYDEKNEKNLEQQEPVKTILLKNKTKNKIYKSRDSNPKINKVKEKSIWKSLVDNLKKGQKNKCTQSEIAMRQCN
jgi:hypothetical protein